MANGTVTGRHPEHPLRRPARMSGVAACIATVLFAVAGTFYLMGVDAPPTFRDQSWEAGEDIVIVDREAMVLWGAGLHGAAQDVTCTVRSARSADGALPAGPGPEHESLAVLDVDGQELTYLDGRSISRPGGHASSPLRTTMLDSIPATSSSGSSAAVSCRATVRPVRGSAAAQNTPDIPS